VRKQHEGGGEKPKDVEVVTPVAEAMLETCADASPSLLADLRRNSWRRSTARILSQDPQTQVRSLRAHYRQLTLLLSRRLDALSAMALKVAAASPKPDPHGFDGNHDGVGCET
jgi:hypothetical protein